ncbi:MAG: hypothetical protein GOMPHAMPRED_002277 [Gomphillus americanus]|uniref:Peptidase S54 rhomboid domain-containing protein n=1 Tax=Gomphillus americanus TaxID=1940652 RepID=A0A8H3IN31_9LECA|nr:MAG: hypothetical protein GOMPHAMPRED_002277 [Gomphillus americanus]
MATSFVSLNLAQKVVIGGILGVCGGVYFLNKATLHQRQRHLREGTTETTRTEKLRQVSTRGYHLGNGQYVTPQSSQGSQPLTGLPAFLENVWTPKFVQENLVLNRKNIQEGRWYTLITSGLNHYRPGHLIMNMLGFWSMGIPLIGSIGAPAFLTIWVASGITGGVASIIRINHRLNSALSQPATSQERYEVARLANTSFVGASGSIFGVFAAYAILYPNSRAGLLFIPVYFRTRILLGVFFAGSVIADFNNWLPGIGHWGHAGGMIVGAAIGYGLRRARLVRSPISMAALLALSTSHMTSIQR